MTIVASSPLHSFAVTFGAVFTGIGLIFLFIGLLIRAISRPFRGGERAQGRIVGYDTSDPTMWRVPGAPVQARFRLGASAFTNDIIYRPRVVFTTYEGTEVTATSRTGTNPRPGKVGDVVTVYYKPNDPQHVRVEAGRVQRTCVEVAFIVLGGVAAAIGIAVLISAH
jgi:hypothetical protein